MSRRYKRKGKIAQKALKLAKKNRRDIAGEIKRVDIILGTTDVTNVTTVGVVTLLSDVDQGDSASQRDGDSIKARSLHIKGKIEWQTGGENTTVTIMVIRKDINNDDNPTKHGAIGVETAVLVTVAPNQLIPLASLQWTNRQNWKVLSRDYFVGNPDSQDNLVFEKYIRLNHRVYYDSATASAGARQGNLFLIAISELVAGTTAPHLSFFSRFKYVDN